MYLKSYKELTVWQKSILLAKEVYLLTEVFPKTEIYGLTSQMRRATISISSNIAEGYGRKSAKEYAQFFSIAYGSALELETQVIISKDLKLTQENNFTKVEQLLLEILKMLNSMSSKMRAKLNASH